MKSVRSKFPDLEIVAGNVATAEATEMLIAAGVDGLFTNAPDVLRPLVAALPGGRDACG